MVCTDTREVFCFLRLTVACIHKTFSYLSVLPGGLFSDTQQTPG
ncbi:Uncharacterised protein [Mycobacterium tuberculosis]|nr:Uncharacterised protein [Mycobacterium tuberculosis]